MRLKPLCLAALMLAAVCVTPASALEYTMDAPDDYLFARPTSRRKLHIFRFIRWMKLNHSVTPPHQTATAMLSCSLMPHRTPTWTGARTRP